MGKKRIYIKVLVVVATVFVIGGIIAKTVDKRRQTYYERISEMLDANWNYQHDLSIEGTLDLFSFDFNLDGINWTKHVCGSVFNLCENSGDSVVCAGICD